MRFICPRCGRSFVEYAATGGVKLCKMCEYKLDKKTRERESRVERYDKRKCLFTGVEEPEVVRRLWDKRLKRKRRKG